MLCSAKMADGNVVEVDFSDLIDKKMDCYLEGCHFLQYRKACEICYKTHTTIPTSESFKVGTFLRQCTMSFHSLEL